MRLGLALLLALALGTTGRAQIAVPGTPSDVATADVSRLLGTWNCDGGTGGGATTETYTRAGATSVALGNAVRTSSGGRGFVSETFVYAPGSATWTVTALPNRFFDGLRASGPVWVRGSQWILTGTESFQKKTMPVRIVYTDLATDSFRREHQVQAGGLWRDDAAYVCRRDTVAATPASAASALALTPAIGIAKSSPAPARVVVKPTAAPVITRPTTARVSVGATTAPAGADATTSAAIAAARTVPVVARSTTVPVVGFTTAPGIARSARTVTRPWRFAPWQFAPAPTASPRTVVASEGRDGSSRLALAPKPTPAPTPAPTLKPTPLPRPTLTPRAKSTDRPVSMNRRSTLPATPTSSAKRIAFLPPASVGRDDRPYGLIGAWACRTTNGGTSTQSYTLGNDGAIALRNALTVDGRRYEIDESYRFDPTREQWHNVTAGGAYRGTASPWRGATWTFDGIETEGTPSEVHMTYTTLGPTTFRRQFARSRSGSWVPYLSEVCRRG